jgi:hypothetical protein
MRVSQREWERRGAEGGRERWRDVWTACGSPPLFGVDDTQGAKKVFLGVEHDALASEPTANSEVDSAAHLEKRRQ